MDFTLLSSAPEETQAIGRRLGLLLRGQEIILVSGDLAAGKTVLIKGIASGLEIPVAEVVSPSYVLMNQYEGTHRLFHFDLYRLGGLLGTRENPVDEFIGAGILAVEWAQYLRSDYFSLDGVIAVDIVTLEGSRRRLRLHTELPGIDLS